MDDIGDYKEIYKLKFGQEYVPYGRRDQQSGSQAGKNLTKGSRGKEIRSQRYKDDDEKALEIERKKLEFFEAEHGPGEYSQFR